MAETIAEAFVRFGFNVDKSSVNEVNSVMGNFKNSLASVSSLSFAFNNIRSAFSAFTAPLRSIGDEVFSVIREGAHLEDLSKKLGVSTQALQSFSYVADHAGIASDTAQQGLAQLNKTVIEAVKGGDNPFAKLGVNVKDASGHMRDMGDLMPEVLDKFSGIQDEGKRSALAMEVFGKQGLAMLPMLRMSKEEIGAINEEFAAFGGAFNEDFVKSSTAFGDSMRSTELIFRNLKREIATGALPVINNLLNRFTEFIRKDWHIFAEGFRSLGKLIAEAFGGVAADVVSTFALTLRDLLADDEKLRKFAATVKLLGGAFAIWAAAANPLGTTLSIIAAAINEILGALQGKESIFDRFADLVKGNAFFEATNSTLGAVVRKVGSWVPGAGVVDDLVQANVLKSNPQIQAFLGEASTEEDRAEMFQAIMRLSKSDFEMDQVQPSRVPQWIESARLETSAPPIVNVNSNTTINVQGGDAPKTAREIKRVIEEGKDSEMRKAAKTFEGVK